MPGLTGISEVLTHKNHGSDVILRDVPGVNLDRQEEHDGDEEA